ncbi:MAG: ATP-dependent Clp protease ATP-binding subunit ClpX, partial [Treponema sp.]|nr:ATP-dependent Clp protease ATP-binding subunit ClpX [Treponema sp.]
LSSSSIGFGAEGTHRTEEERMELLNQVTSDDLVRFGIIPELIGRLPITCALKELDRDDLVRILTEPKNAITKQFQASFAIDDVDLSFDEESIHEIADIAIKNKTGARGLRAIVEKILLDLMFEIPSIKGKKRLTITKDIVMQRNIPSPEMLLIDQKTA